MRTGVTLADITRAADQLLADGERPTVEGVRKVLGTGSPGTVNTLLKEYFQTLPARLNLPAPIATAAAELYEKLKATAQEDMAAQRVEMERDIAAERERLAQERREFEAERTAFQQRVADLNNDLDRLREQLKTTGTRLASIEKELSAQTTRARTAEAQFRAAEDERERSAQKHASELARLREQAEGNERHLLARIEEQKAQIQRSLLDREREAAAAAKQVSTLETSLSEASKSAASLRAELTTAQRDLTKKQELTTAAETALARAQDQAAKDLASKQAEVDRARVELDLLGNAGEQHKRDRDEAVREAARLEGRLSAVLTQLEEAKAEVRRLQQTRTAGPAAGSEGSAKT